MSSVSHMIYFQHIYIYQLYILHIYNIFCLWETCSSVCCALCKNKIFFQSVRQHSIVQADTASSKAIASIHPVWIIMFFYISSAGKGRVITSKFRQWVSGPHLKCRETYKYIGIFSRAFFQLLDFQNWLASNVCKLILC